MNSLAQQQKALNEDKSKVLKFFKALKKLMSKEFLWVLAALILGIPIAYVVQLLLTEALPKVALDALVKFLDDTPLYIGAYAISLVGIYFTRTVVGAIQTLVKKDKE